MKRCIYFWTLFVAFCSLEVPLRAEWVYPQTKKRPVLILDVAPGVLFKGPSSKVSVLYNVDSDGNLTDPFGNTQRVNWDAAIGLRASAQVMANNKGSADFIYTGLFNWTRDKTAQDVDNGVGVLTSPYTTDDWQNADKIEWSTKTSFNSYELAMWHHITPRYEEIFSFSFMLGGRFINIIDTDLFFSFKTLAQKPSILRAETDNWLRGGGFGFEVACRPLSYLMWTVQLKGDFFADAIERNIRLTDDQNTNVVADTTDLDRTVVAGLGEAVPALVIQNNRFFFKFTGTVTYIVNLSTTAPSFEKIRKITDIKTTPKFFLGGIYIGAGYIF